MAEETTVMKCSGEECKSSFPDHFEGRNQAWRDGWYIEKWGEGAWCPEHIPSWVPSSFKKEV